jgi:hypothetical protein
LPSNPSNPTHAPLKTGSGKRGDPYLYTFIENNLGKEYSPITSHAELEDSFPSAFPRTMQEEGIEMIGRVEGQAAMPLCVCVIPPETYRTVRTLPLHACIDCSSGSNTVLKKERKKKKGGKKERK